MSGTALATRELGRSGLKVTQIGLGCMGLTHSIGDPSKLTKEDNIKLIISAYESGITFFDTAEVYGPYTNEAVIGEALKAGNIPRDKIVIATKCGIKAGANGLEVDSKPATIRKAIAGSLERLGVSYIDLYYIHRIDPDTPIEDVARTMKELKEEGLIRHWGVSEAAVSTIRRAHAIFPLTAVQNEYSIMCRDVEKELLPALEELGIGLVAFSPLGRALLTATFKAEELCATDFRRNHPRLSGENLDKNQPLVELVKKWADQKGCTPAQFALAWVIAQRPYIVPIPGTTKVSRLAENLKALEVAASLTAEDVKTFNAALDGIAVHGDRYTAANLKLINK